MFKIRRSIGFGKDCGRRYFTKQEGKGENKGPKLNNSEFKAFFRLRIQDRPIKLVSKIKETYKTNKTIRRFIFVGKYLFGKSIIIHTLKFEPELI